MAQETGDNIAIAFALAPVPDSYLFLFIFAFMQKDLILFMAKFNDSLLMKKPGSLPNTKEVFSLFQVISHEYLGGNFVCYFALQ